MKKKLLLLLSMVALLVCLFAISVSAETVLKPQTSNAYGEISLFDESVSVGRTHVGHGFSPYIAANSTTYARIVIGDGTTFYTFPTAYALSGTATYGGDGKCLFVLDLASLNTAVANATNSASPNWTHENIYRIEMPYNMLYIGSGSSQAFSEWTNVIEIRLQPNTTTKDTGRTMLFWCCNNLETIHNLDTFVFKTGCTNGSFQNCYKLKSVTIAPSPDITDTQENMFAGCTSLETFDIVASFPNLTTVGKAMFNGCTALKSITIPKGFTLINDKAFQNCSSLASVTFEGTAGTNAVIGEAAFENCYSIGDVSIPEGVTTLKNCAFNYAGVRNLSLPSTLTTLGGSNHFNIWNNKGLVVYKIQSVTGLEKTKLTSISYGMFRSQVEWSPKTVVVPNTVTTIGTYGFADVPLENIYLGATLTQIDNEAFTGCSNLTNVYVPGTITTLGDKPFNGKGVYFFVTSSDKDYLNTINAKAGSSNAYVSYADYKANPDNYKSGKYIIYGLNSCETFYAGIHDTEGVTGTNQFKGDEYITDYICVSGCNRNCGMQAETKLCGPLFTNKGYSKTADGKMFTYGVVINEENIASYVAITKEAFNYGVIIGAAELDENGDVVDKDAIIDNTGASLITSSIVVDFAKVELENFTIYNVKMQGIETEAQQKLPIYCCAYIIDGSAVSYMGNSVSDKPTTISSSAITVIETTTTTPTTGDENA